MAKTYSAAADSLKSYGSGGASDPSRNVFLITPDDNNNLATYARALRIYVSSGPAAVRVVPVDAVDDTNFIELTFPTGLWVEDVSVRRVLSTGLTGAPIIHGYQ